MFHDGGKAPHFFSMHPDFLHFFRCKLSGQIIATSHDLTLNWWFSKGNPLISGKSRLVLFF